MGRKTVDVDYVLRRCNWFLAASPCGEDWDNKRRGMIGLTEAILHETGRYGGFNYITRAMLGQPVAPDTDERYHEHGGEWRLPDDTLSGPDDPAAKHHVVNETRRFYYFTRAGR